MPQPQKMPVAPHIVEAVSHEQLRISAPSESVPGDVIRATQWELPSIWAFARSRYSAQDVREMKAEVRSPDVTESEIYAMMHHAIPGHARFTDEGDYGRIVIVYFRKQPFDKMDGPYWEIDVKHRKIEVAGKYVDGVKVGVWIKFSPHEVLMQKFNEKGGLIFSKISKCGHDKEEGEVELTLFRPGTTPQHEKPLIRVTWPCPYFPLEVYATVTPYNQWGTNLVALWYA